MNDTMNQNEQLMCDKCYIWPSRELPCGRWLCPDCRQRHAPTCWRCREAEQWELADAVNHWELNRRRWI